MTRTGRAKQVKRSVRRNRSGSGRPSARQAVLVLGMHRSGTSALTRVLSFLGASLPKNLMGASAGNETGHWEPLDLVAVHDEMLGSIGSNWHDWRAIDPDWSRSSTAEAFKLKLLGGLADNYGEAPLLVVKDPRICRFVPLWSDVIHRHGAAVQVVMLLRNPLEVAASLRERDGFLAAKSLLLWLRHALDAEHDTRDLPRALVTYDLLMSDWRALAADIAAKTDIRWPRRSDAAELEIERFLSSNYRHHKVDPADLPARRSVVDWVNSAYATLLAMANGHDDAPHQRRLDAIRSEFNKAASAFGLVLADEGDRVVRAQSDAARLGAELGSVRQDTVRLREALEVSQRDAAENERAFSQRREQFTHDLEAARGFLRESQTDVQRLGGELDSALRAEASAAAETKATRELLVRKDDEIGQLSKQLHAVRAEVDAKIAAEQQAEARVQALNAEIASLRQNEVRMTVALQVAQDETAAASARLAVTRQKIDHLSATLEATRKSTHRTQLETQRLTAALVEERRHKAADAGRVANLTQKLKAANTRAERISNEAGALRRALDERRWSARLGHRLALARPARFAIRREYNEIRAAMLFEAEWYLARYPDVAAAGIDPLEHYIRFGSGEGRNPHPLFDSQWYATQAPDLAASRLSALGHYISIGAARGLDPNPLFDTDRYLAQHPDVAAAGLNPLRHFWKNGGGDGLDHT